MPPPSDPTAMFPTILVATKIPVGRFGSMRRSSHPHTQQPSPNLGLVAIKIPVGRFGSMHRSSHPRSQHTLGPSHPHVASSVRGSSYLIGAGDDPRVWCLSRRLQTCCSQLSSAEKKIKMSEKCHKCQNVRKREKEPPYLDVCRRVGDCFGCGRTFDVVFG